LRRATTLISTAVPNSQSASSFGPCPHAFLKLLALYSMLRPSMDWREHPWLDDRWYNALPFGYIGPAMTAEEIAQDIDRNYDASQPGKVINNCKEEYYL